MINKITSQMPNLLPGFKPTEETNNDSVSFEKMLFEGIQSVENNQIQTKNSMYTLLTTGEGNTHEALIAMQKATSQIKTMALVRDKFVESYQNIMSMQL